MKPIFTEYFTEYFYTRNGGTRGKGVMAVSLRLYGTYEHADPCNV